MTKCSREETWVFFAKRRQWRLVHNCDCGHVYACCIFGAFCLAAHASTQLFVSWDTPCSQTCVLYTAMNFIWMSTYSVACHIRFSSNSYWRLMVSSLVYSTLFLCHGHILEPERSCNLTPWFMSSTIMDQGSCTHVLSCIHNFLRMHVDRIQKEETYKRKEFRLSEYR